MCLRNRLRRYLLVSVFITAGSTITSLLLIVLEDIAATLRRVAVRVRDMVLVIVSVESLDTDSSYSL